MWAAYAMAGELRQMWLGKGGVGSTQVPYCPVLHDTHSLPDACQSSTELPSAKQVICFDSKLCPRSAHSAWKLGAHCQ